MKTNNLSNKIKSDIIIISGEDGRRYYICNYCNRNLVKISDSNGKNVAWYCNQCSIEYNPEIEQIRSKSKLTTPEGRNTETLVATTPDPVSEFDHEEIEVKGAFQQLRNKGIKIKDYRETDGSGRVIS